MQNIPSPKLAHQVIFIPPETDGYLRKTLDENEPLPASAFKINED